MTEFTGLAKVQTIEVTVECHPVLIELVLTDYQDFRYGFSESPDY